MDAIRRDDIEWARRTAPGEKLIQAFEMMRFGIEMKKSALRAKHPHATEPELEQLLRAWLEADG